jgi:hypothetical protein
MLDRDDGLTATEASPRMAARQTADWMSRL